MKIRKTVLAALAAVTLLGGACSSETATGSVLEQHGLDDRDGVALVDELETTALDDRTDAYLVSVRPDELVVTDAATEEQESIPLPEDKFYLSIAPYTTQTHPCTFHSLTTCVGELRNADIDVEVVTSDGETLVSDTIQTEDNGFFGLWLPKDVEGQISMSYDGKSVTAPFTTKGADTKTCETDLQLV